MEFYLTRRQAYELAWSKPMREVASALGVTEVGVAKRLRKWRIPIPPQGYWNRIAAGHPAAKSELPPADLGTPVYVPVPGQLTSAAKALFTGEAGQLSPGEDEPVEVFSERFRNRIGRLSVDQFRTTHHEITRVKANAARVNARGPYGGPILVGKAEERRLRFINALLQAAEQYGRGGYLRCSHDQIEVSLTFGGVTVSMDVQFADIDKRVLEIKVRRHGYKPGPTGWRDDRASSLEDRLTDIIVEIAAFGIVVRWQLDEQSTRLRAQEAARMAEIAEAARIAALEAAETEQRQAKERAIRALLEAAESRQKAETIRGLVAELNKDARLATRDGLADWTRWAIEQADRLDPVLNGTLDRMIGAAVDKRSQAGELPSAGEKSDA